MATGTHINQVVGDQGRMLNFVLPWLEFGGGPSDEIFVQFGVSEKVFFQRLDMLASDVRFSVPDDLRRRLHSVSRERIAHVESKTDNRRRIEN